MPPPKEITLHNIISQKDVLSGPEIDASKENLLFKLSLYHSFAPTLTINNYNYWIDNILPQQFNEELLTKKGKKIKIISATYDFPKVFPQLNKITVERTFPRLAREFGTSYAGRIYIFYEEDDDPGNIHKACIGEIPVMLGSNRCYLSYPPDGISIDEWKSLLSECPNDPLTYFINKGAEKLLINQEKMRRCQYFTLLSTGKQQNLMTHITCLNKVKTSVVKISTSKEGIHNVIISHPQRGNFTSYQLYQIVYCLYFHQFKTNENVSIDFNEFNDLLYSLASPDERDRIKIAMLPTIFSLREYTDDDGNIQYRSIKESLVNRFKMSIEEIITLVFKDLFDPCDNVSDKISNLLIALLQHLRSYINIREKDDRDVWGSKMIHDPSGLIEQALYQTWEECKLSSDGHFDPNNKFGFITKRFQDSFANNQWGTSKAAGKKENIADALKRNTILGMISQINKINTRVDRRAKNPRIRALNPTQGGLICIAETPEGSNCGLIKHYASIANISKLRIFEKGRNEIISSIKKKNKLLSKEKTDQFEYEFNVFFITDKRDKSPSIDDKTRRSVYKYTNINIVEFLKKKFTVYKYSTSSSTTSENLNIYIDIKEKKRYHEFFDELKQDPYEFFVRKRSDGNTDDDDTFGLQYSPQKSAEKSTEKNAEKTAEKYIYMFTVNGNVFFEKTKFLPKPLWCSEKLATYLKNLRRIGKLPRDSLILLNKIDHKIEYCDDSGRVSAMLLTFDSDGDLVIDKKNLWYLLHKPMNTEELQELYGLSSDIIEKLFQEGAIELIDAREKENIFVSTSIHKARKISRIRHLLNENVDDDLINGIQYDRRSADYLMANIVRNLNLFPDTKADPTYNQQMTYDELLNIFIELQDEEIRNIIKIHLNVRFKYTHSLIDPNALFSVSTTMIPRCNDMQGPRITYQGSMNGQALCDFHTQSDSTVYTSYKLSLSTKRSSFESLAAEAIGLTYMPNTENPVVAVLADPNNFEDAVIWNEEYLKRNNLFYEKVMTVKTSEVTTSNYQEICKKPSEDEKYRHLDKNGLPRLGSVIKQGDCVIGKVRINTDSPIEQKASIFSEFGMEGVVCKVRVTYNEEAKESKKMIAVKIRYRRVCIVGDKGAFRYSQKGTGGAIYPQSRMPVIVGGPNNGVTPDLIINPMFLPTRMTIGMPKEFKINKAAVYSVERYNCISFENLDMQHVEKILSSFGMDKHGDEIMRHPNGEIMMDSTTGYPMKVFIGPCSYQMLAHHVLDKIQYRSTGGVDMKTQQSVRGRGRHGGTKVGEMERDTMISHGTSDTLWERLCFSADKYSITYCKNCNNLSTSAQAIKSNKCAICNTAGQIGVVVQSRIFKLFIHLLQGACINVGVETRLKAK